MHEQHHARTTIFTHGADPDGATPSVLVSIDTDKREEGYQNTATLTITERAPSYPQQMNAQMTADEWEILGRAALVQASILRGGVGR
jgi:hypothetical protein